MGLIGVIARRTGRVILDGVVLLLVLMLLPGLPPNVKYSHYEVEESLPFEGPLRKNDLLNDAGRILDGEINGPESIASRGRHELFTSLHNGKILRVWGKNFDHFQTVTTIGPGCDGPWQESKCGRPLGLRFAPDGRLVVVDAYLGLFALDVDSGKKERLVDPALEIEGVVPKIPDDLDIDEDGNIYWSDASTVGDLSDGFIEMLSDPSGRLIKFDSKTQTNVVLVKGVHFANGVQLSPDRDFVLFCETFRSRVLRHWLNGPNAGKTDVFVDRLPGKPDNIRAKKDGGYYVSLVAVEDKTKVDTTKILAKLPLVRKLILRLLGIPKFFFDTVTKIFPNQFTENASYKTYHLQPIAELIASNAAVVVELDAEGNIESSLQGDNGVVRFISETEQVGDYLFFGSPYNDYLGYLRVAYEDDEDEDVPTMEVDGEGIRMKSVEDEQKTEVEKEDAGEVAEKSKPEPEIVVLLKDEEERVEPKEVKEVQSEQEAEVIVEQKKEVEVEQKEVKVDDKIEVEIEQKEEVQVEQQEVEEVEVEQKEVKVDDKIEVEVEQKEEVQVERQKVEEVEVGQKEVKVDDKIEVEVEQKEEVQVEQQEVKEEVDESINVEVEIPEEHIAEVETGKSAQGDKVEEPPSKAEL